MEKHATRLMRSGSSPGCAGEAVEVCQFRELSHAVILGCRKEPRAEAEAREFFIVRIGAALLDGEEDLGDELVFRSDTRIVHVVLDVVAVAKGKAQLVRKLEGAAAGASKIGLGTGEDETAVLSTGEFFIAQHIWLFGRRRGQGNSGAVDLRADFEEAHVSGDLVVLSDCGNKRMEGLPGLRSILPKWADSLKEEVVRFRPEDRVRNFGQIHGGLLQGLDVRLGTVKEQFEITVKVIGGTRRLWRRCALPWRE